MNSLPGVQIWSAAPTPLTSDLKVDLPSVERMIRDAIASGIHGVFLGGTCGEGPWLQDRERSRLIEGAKRVAEGKLKIAAQVSDNSVPRILDNIVRMADAGADYAIIASPANFLNPTADRIAALFIEATEASPLPVGIYDLGRHRPIEIPEQRLKEIYLHPKVHFVKDSSGLPSRRAIAVEASKSKPALRLFNGDEFRCVDYLEAGYRGCMFGGAAAVPSQLREITSLFLAGRVDEARAVETEMKRILFSIYGGELIPCWLTGLKYYMVRRGLFSSTASFLGYPLADDCRSFIEAYAAGK